MIAKLVKNIFGGHSAPPQNMTVETLQAESLEHFAVMKEFLARKGLTFPESDVVLSPYKVTMFFVDDDLRDLPEKKRKFMNFISSLDEDNIHGMVSEDAIISTPNLNINCANDGKVLYRLIITSDEGDE